MATLKEVLEFLQDPDCAEDIPVSVGSVLNMEVRFCTGTDELHILSTYVADGMIIVDIGE